MTTPSTTATPAAPTSASPAPARGPRPPRFRSLASRLVALGLLQLSLLAGAAVAIWFLEGPHGEARPDEQIDRAALQRLEALADRPADLTAALTDLRRRRIEASVYDGDRRLVASNVDPPLAIPERPRPPPAALLEGPDRPFDRGPPGRPPVDGPLLDRPLLDRPPLDRPLLDRPPGRHPPLGPPPHPSMVARLRVHGAPGFLVARGVHRPPPGATGPLITLLCGVVVLVLGAWLTARWILRPIDQLARATRALGAGDLRTRSRLRRADEIGALGRGFDDMADRIESLLLSEKELLANVAHELRTPLARIGVALDLASEGDAAMARASLGEIAVDVAELSTIIDDILTATRFEIAAGVAGEPHFTLRPATTAAAAIAAAAAARFRARHVRPLEVAVADDLPALEVDPMLFRRVIDNLLENAHKYTPDRDRPVRLAVSRAHDGIAFEVVDRGVGIADADLPRIFTPFFRGDRSRSRETGGVGLGLTLARRIAQAHGGRIEVRSRAGEGTTARVVVPAAPAETI